GGAVHRGPGGLHEVDAGRPHHAGHRPGRGGGHPDGHRHRPRLPARVVDRPGLRGHRRGPDVAALLGVSHRRAPVRAAGLRGGGAGRPRRHDRGPARQPDRGRRRGARLLLSRERVEGSHLLRALHRGPRVPPRRPLRPARVRDARGLIHVKRDVPAVVLFGLAALAPLVTRDGFLLDSLILILLWGAVSGAWNVAGGYAGQVSLGHSAFFGLGAYSAALLA